MKPSTARVFEYLRSNKAREVPAMKLLNSLRMIDYRSRISEINREFRSRGSLSRVVSRRIPGRTTNAYRLVLFETSL